MGGGEIASTEEALYAITKINNQMKDGIDPVKMNMLTTLSSSVDSMDASCGINVSVGVDGMNKLGGDDSPTPQINNGSVGMDGMNNLGGDSSPSSQIHNRAAGMDGMNNLGGDFSPTSQLFVDPSCELEQVDPSCELEQVDSDEETITTLCDLFREGGGLRGETITCNSADDKEKREKK